jgi:hypothetical protein
MIRYYGVMNKIERLSEEEKELYVGVAKIIKGSERRLFMAHVVRMLGRGGQAYAEAELNWNRRTIRKGLQELESGQVNEDNFKARGRKRAEEHLPNLLADIKEIVDGWSQTDPTFRTTRLYTRITAKEVRQQLIEQKGYQAEELPSGVTINTKMNDLGYRLRAVKKSQPKQKIPETDAIFEQLNQIHRQAQEDETILRMSFDAKATVLIGAFSRGGVSRVEVKAQDHDFRPESKVTPFGILLPDHDRLFLYFASGKITSDFIVDCIRACWADIKDEFPQVTTLLLNQDNGPENHSRRTQFMHRLTQWVDQEKLTIQLAYYPPYHSKYNPIERVWGVLEQHWNGSLLDSLETVLGFAHTLNWKQSKPVVHLVKTLYQTGIKLSQKAMNLLEKRFERLDGLGKWFVTIRPLAGT